jgi:hypothetical protein
MIEKFARAFVRDNDGSWFCREPVHFVGYHGPFTTTPGVTYRKGKLNQGYDVAVWLDEWHSQQLVPIGVQFL